MSAVYIFHPHGTIELPTQNSINTFSAEALHESVVGRVYAASAVGVQCIVPEHHVRCWVADNEASYPGCKPGMFNLP